MTFDEAEPRIEKLTIVRNGGKSDGQTRAAALVAPTLQAAGTLTMFKQLGLSEESLADILDALNDQSEKAQGGDLSRLESMLAVQAHLLDAIFQVMTRSALSNIDSHLNATQIYMQLAMKAQSQCRTTIEALAEIKNPRAVAFIKQQNNAAGHQQVNNCNSPAPATSRRARARKKADSTNRLLEISHEEGQQLDTEAASSAIGRHPKMEAVGSRKRAAHSRGQGQDRAECKKARHV